MLQCLVYSYVNRDNHAPILIATVSPTPIPQALGFKYIVIDTKIKHIIHEHIYQTVVFTCTIQVVLGPANRTPTCILLISACHF